MEVAGYLNTVYGSLAGSLFLPNTKDRTAAASATLGFAVSAGSWSVPPHRDS